ncbi:MAG: HD-GYP domain-containing protein [Gammaproteobacteria bacterium]|nr:HD-GYP domain-containing protein [Gammaproteobacteria bacterium]
MSLKEVKIRIEDLEPGMYVCQLDRPWVETPFLLQGFHIKSQDEINQLLEYCQYVYIDVELSKASENIIPFTKTNNTSEQEKQTLTNIKPIKYQDKTDLPEELKSAKNDHIMLSHAIESFMVDIANNKKLELPALKNAITPMVDSIIRNPDAFAWLTRIKTKDNYTYNHSVSASVWAVAFGRHLGLPKKDLQSLAIGAMLFDVGKVKLPEKLINNKNRFNQYEFKLVKKHVEYSIDIIKEIKGINDDILNMVITHHERHNGSGYPNGLAGNQIPLFGKIAGIVDCYDAIISERPFASPISPHDAVKKLYEWRNLDFQSELVEQFIQVVGIYPVGTIVELSDGQVGVITAQNRVWRLRPQVMMLLDENKEPLIEFKTINLFTATEDASRNPLDILRCVDPGLYGIDPEEFYL